MAKNRGHHSPDNIHEALEVLDHAAREKQEEVYNALENQYDDLKKVMSEITSSVKEKTQNFRERATQSLHQGQKKVEESVGSAREQIKQVDENVHEHPWAYVSGVAASAFLIGYALSRKKGNKQ